MSNHPTLDPLDIYGNRTHVRHDLHPRPLAWRVVVLRRSLLDVVEVDARFDSEQEATARAAVINRRPGWWSVVDTLFECGCWSYARLPEDPR